MMKVLLRRNVKKLGQIGEVVTVRPGFARNYLLPQGLAVMPSAANLKAIEAEKTQYLSELARLKAEFETRARALEGKSFSIVARANQEGHLYGSVGPAQIVETMGRESCIVETDMIQLPEAIRAVGTHEVTIEFTEQVTAKITIVVTRLKEEGEEEEEAPAPAAEAPKAEKPAEEGQAK